MGDDLGKGGEKVVGVSFQMVRKEPRARAENKKVRIVWPPTRIRAGGRSCSPHEISQYLGLLDINVNVRWKARQVPYT